jgi:hypothetical protein
VLGREGVDGGVVESRARRCGWDARRVFERLGLGGWGWRVWRGLGREQVAVFVVDGVERVRV